MKAERMMIEVRESLMRLFSIWISSTFTKKGIEQAMALRIGSFKE
jgi:hypothetical protein